MGRYSMSVTDRGRSWEIKNSLWILFSFIFLINGIGMVIMGNRVRVKKWRNFGLLYTALGWISILVSPYLPIIDTLCMLTFFLSYLACIIHSFSIRSEYLLRLDILDKQKQRQLNSLRHKVAAEYGIQEHEVENEAPAESRMGISGTGDDAPKNIGTMNSGIMNSGTVNRRTINSETIHNEIGPATGNDYTHPENNRQQDPLLDINSCTEADLAGLPGVGLILAKKAIRLRESKNGFSSVDEFIEGIGVKPHHVERLKNLVVCKPVKSADAGIKGGRMVDF